MSTSNESKHTPGPWSVPHFAEPDVNCQCGYVLTDNLMGAVATVHCSGEGDDWERSGDNPKFAEACANARLIAAAPDLLRVAKAILSLASQEPAAARLSIVERVELADIIAKAEGRQ